MMREQIVIVFILNFLLNPFENGFPLVLRCPASCADNPVLDVGNRGSNRHDLADTCSSVFQVRAFLTIAPIKM